MQDLAQKNPFFQDLLSKEEEQKKRMKLPIFQIKSIIKIK